MKDYLFELFDTDGAIVFTRLVRAMSRAEACYKVGTASYAAQRWTMTEVKA